MRPPANAEEALRAGDVPLAPSYVGWCQALGATAGLAAGVGVAQWPSLARATFGGGPLSEAWRSALSVFLTVLSLTLVGAVLGLVLAQVTLGAFSLRWRFALRQSRPVAPGLVRWWVAAALAALFVPEVLAATATGDDLGRLVLLAPLLALLTGLALFALPALAQRSRARQVWRQRVAPEQPPRRDLDELPPEIRHAIRARSS